VDVHLLIDVLYMGIDSIDRDDESLCDGVGGVAAGYQADYLGFALRKCELYPDSFANLIEL
jgi:hypothetical protein